MAFVSSDIERFAAVVEMATIAANDYNLNLARYVHTAEDAGSPR